MEQLSAEPISLSRCKRAFYGKSRPRRLAHILNNVSSTDMNKFEKEKMEKKRLFKENT